jgi:hypothetical protein
MIYSVNDSFDRYIKNLDLLTTIKIRARVVLPSRVDQTAQRVLSEITGKSSAPVETKRYPNRLLNELRARIRERESSPNRLLQEIRDCIAQRAARQSQH